MIKVNRLKLLIIAEDTEDVEALNQSIEELLALAGHPKPIVNPPSSPSTKEPIVTTAEVPSRRKKVPDKAEDEPTGRFLIHKVPCLVALPRRLIGKSLGLSMEKQSLVGVIDPNGAFNHFKPLLSFTLDE